MRCLVYFPSSAGDSAVVVGYGGTGRHCGPSLTSGIISKAIRLKGQLVMLQTTCAVQAGASGGAVVQRHSGELLGRKHRGSRSSDPPTGGARAPLNSRIRSCVFCNGLCFKEPFFFLFSGIVSSNTRDQAAKVTYPHLNFIIPVTVFQRLLQQFHVKKDIKVLRVLDTTDAEVKKVWRLQGAKSKL